MIKFFIAIVIASSIVFAQGNDVLQLSIDSLLSIKVNTVSKYYQTSSEAPASVSIITSQDIELFGYKTVLEALSSLRSFYISYDRNYGYLGTRGFSRPTDYNNRILVLVNGRTINENFYGSAYLEGALGINIHSIDRIEVVRGPGSVIYGTGAMFAIVNIITKKSSQINNLDISASTGSFGNMNGHFMAGKNFDSDASLFISGVASSTNGENQYYKEFDSPETNNGIAEELDWEKYYGVFSSVAVGDFYFQGNFALRKKGVPTAPYKSFFNANDISTNDKYGFLELTYHNVLTSDKELTLKSYYQHYGYDGSYPYEGNVQKDATTNNWFGFEGQFFWDLSANNHLITGIEYVSQLRADYRSWDVDTTYFNSDFPSYSLSFYANDEFQISNNLSLILGIRGDYYSRYKNYTAPRAALIYNMFKGTSLKLLYGEAFRVPNLYETYYEDIITAKSNPNLKPENIKTFEFIAEQKISSEIMGLLSIYKNNMKNLIDQFIDPQDSLIQNKNLSSVNALGCELELNYISLNKIKGYFNYGIQKTTDSESNLKLSNSPQQILRAGIVYPFYHNIFTALEMRYESDRITLSDYKTKSFFISNANLSFLDLWENINLYFTVYNLFNQEYSYPAGYEHRQAEIKQDGRNYLFRISLGL